MKTVLLLTLLAASVPDAAQALASAPAATAHPAARFAEAQRPAPRTTKALARHVEAWREGEVYKLTTTPGRLSDVTLQAGEVLVAVAAGDTARWVIGDTSSGLGTTRRTHILVKPTAAPLRTNMVVTTDRRTYHLELETGREPTTSLAWTYPEDELLALRKSQSDIAAAQPVATAVAIDALNFNYSIDGDSPSWRPLRVFDDGRQVFIEFPATMANGDAPPLFAIAESGDPALVNYRQRGQYYVVDRLFEAAELRLGGRHQKVVRITRGNRRPRRHGRP